jgi:hypothetical protein
VAVAAELRGQSLDIATLLESSNSLENLRSWHARGLRKLRDAHLALRLSEAPGKAKQAQIDELVVRFERAKDAIEDRIRNSCEPVLERDGFCNGTGFRSRSGYWRDGKRRTAGIGYRDGMGCSGRIGYRSGMG